MSNTDLITPDLLTQLSYEKVNYKLLAGKVGEYLKVIEEFKTNKRAETFYKKCNMESELKKLINPNKASQVEMEWMAK